MRFVGLAVFFLSIPGFYALMSGPVQQRRFGWFAIGMAPFVISLWHLEVSVVSWGFWPGYVKGMIVSLLDSLALAVILTDRGTVRGKTLLWPYLLFLLGSGIATFFASPMLASFFWTWQLARAILVFAAVSRIASRPEGIGHVVGGLAAGIAINAFFSLQQRAEGVTQASGTLGHQNLLGLCTHFALFLSLAAMLAGDRRWLIKLGVVGGLIAVVLTGSRATTGLAGVGLVLLILLSMIRKPTAFKTRVASIGMVGLLVAAPVAVLTLQTRFKNAPLEGTSDERAAFERAANAMWSDHPMGVGANQYVLKANLGGYSQRAGVIWNASSRAANVHNTYLLMGAEMGYLGLATFLVLLSTAILKSLSLAWARPRTSSGEYALGAAVALIVVALHCFYEWVFVTWNAQYLFAITLGIIAGVAKQQRMEAMIRRRRPGPVAAEPMAPQPWTAPLPA